MHVHVTVFLTVVWTQQEDRYGKMDCQHWPVDLELPTAFWVDPKLDDKKKQKVQVHGAVLGPDGKCKLNITDGNIDEGSMLFNLSGAHSSTKPGIPRPPSSTGS